MSEIEKAVTTLIQAMEVVRDQNGWWTHPGVPDFGESVERYNAWKAAQGIETTYAELDSEDDDHPVYVAYFENADTNISQWNPAPPAGDGWFTLSIHETEDGPIWVWARRAGAATAAQIAASDSDPDIGRAVDQSEGAKA
jgi:hypothetical protein